MKNALKELQNKTREQRSPIEQCIVDAATFEEAEHDGEMKLMEQAASDLRLALAALKKAKSVFDAAYVHEDLRLAEKYIDTALDGLEAK
jgi:hypothetical protein